MKPIRLRRVRPDQVQRSRHEVIDAGTLGQVGRIVDDVRRRGEAALRRHAERLGDLRRGEPMVFDRGDLAVAYQALPAAQRRVLNNTARRIRTFAEKQRACLRELTVEIAGGRAGHTIAPMERAGCYAPGGRFPLPSSVLMTAITARVAGVKSVWVASPRPAPETLAAAHVAGADALLAVGGAQAIAALAYGAGSVPPCDIIVGPGNRWVTAAKKLVAGHVAIDMLAGPSELVVLADGSANPALVAIDLLAQAEHDPDAFSALVTTHRALIGAVERELTRQLENLPTARTALAALRHGIVVLASSLDEAIEVCNELAPEHLEVMTRDARRTGKRLGHYGALFIGSRSAEVLGDYGAGPNHVLPTSGTARFTGGLSVFHFLRIRTWLESGREIALVPVLSDAVAFAETEGLSAHARAAKARLKSK